MRAAQSPQVDARFVSGVAHEAAAPRAVQKSNEQWVARCVGAVVTTGGTDRVRTCVGGARAGPGLVGATGPKNEKPALQAATLSTQELQYLFPFESAGALGIPRAQSAVQKRPQSGRAPPSDRLAHAPHVVASPLSGVVQTVSDPRPPHRSNVHRGGLEAVWQTPRLGRSAAGRPKSLMTHS